MKKIICLLFVLMMTLFLASCSNTDNDINATVVTPTTLSDESDSHSGIPLSKDLSAIASSED